MTWKSPEDTVAKRISDTESEKHLFLDLLDPEKVQSKPDTVSLDLSQFKIIHKLLFCKQRLGMWDGVSYRTNYEESITRKTLKSELPSILVVGTLSR